MVDLGEVGPTLPCCGAYPWHRADCPIVTALIEAWPDEPISGQSYSQDVRSRWPIHITERPVMISASTCALRAAVALRKAEDAQSSEAAMALVAVADAWTRLVGTMALHDVVLNGNSPEMSDAEHLGPLEQVGTHHL